MSWRRSPSSSASRRASCDDAPATRSSARASAAWSAPETAARARRTISAPSSSYLPRASWAAALPHPLAPRAEGVGPGLHRVEVVGVGLEPERAAPAVVVDEAERRLVPPRLVAPPVADARGQQVVPLLEDVGRDREGIADHALGWIPAVVHRGADVLDDDGAALGLHRQRSTR